MGEPSISFGLISDFPIQPEEFYVVVRATPDPVSVTPQYGAHSITMESVFGDPHSANRKKRWEARRRRVFYYSVMKQARRSGSLVRIQHELESRVHVSIIKYINGATVAQW